MKSSTNTQKSSVDQLADATYTFITPDSLRNTVLGKGLRDDQLKAVALAVEIVDLPGGELIMGPEDNVLPVVVLLSGSAMGYAFMSDMVFPVNAGDLIGEMTYVGGKATPVTVITQETSRVALLTATAIDSLQRKRPQVVSQIISNIGEALRADLRAAHKSLGSAGRTTPADSGSRSSAFTLS